MFGIVKQVVHVEGMHCGHCAMNVEAALRRVEGVKAAKADFEKKLCVIKAKPAITEDQAKKAIESIGFTFVGLE